MARHATVIDRIDDVWGDTWDVREYRPTQHGFPVAFGWPHGEPRGKGAAGGPRLIVTAELRDYMEGLRGTRRLVALPVGANTIKRLRRLLGHHGSIDRAAWWEERAEDLTDLTISEFCRRHNVAPGTVSEARTALFGSRQRAPGWWLERDVVEILLSKRPRSDIAELLGISVGSVGRLRWAVGKDSTRPERALSADELMRAEKMLLSGARVTAVARSLGASPNTIYGAIGSGRLPKSRYAEKRKEVTDLAIALLREGIGPTEISRQTGLPPATINRYRAEAGLEVRPMRHAARRARNQQRAEEALALHRSGAKPGEIAKAMGLSIATISRYLRADGPKNPGSGEDDA